MQPGGNTGSYYGPAKNNAQNGAMDYIHIFSPSLLLEAKASYTNIYLAAQQQNYGTGAGAAYGMANVNIDANTSGLPPVTITGYGSLGDGTSLPIVYVNDIFQYQAAVTYTRGKHNIKIGGGLIRRQASSAQSGTGEGLWGFNTSSVTSSGTTTTPQYSSLQNLLQGAYGTVTRNYSLVVPHYRTWEPHGFVQDDWHVTSTLTVNLGARYDIFTPYTEVHNNISNFDAIDARIVVAGRDGTSSTAGIKLVASGMNRPLTPCGSRRGYLRCWGIRSEIT